MVLNTSFHWRGPSILKIKRVIIIAHGQTGVLLKGLPLLGYMKTIKMIVLRSTISPALVCTQFIVARHGARTGGERLIFTTVAAAVMVVHIVGLFFYVVVVVVVVVVLGFLGSASTPCRNACCRCHANGTAS